MNKNVVINLGNNNGWYPKGQARLVESLKKCGGDFDILTFKDEDEINAPKHINNPYAFKPYAFMKAIELGYQNILWLDCSVWAIKNIDPIFKIINDNGYFMFHSGQYCKNWINDNCLKYFNEKRENLNYLMFVAGLFGLNINNEISKTFLTKWKVAADSGAFKGEWKDHRHDMTCGSIIANQLNMFYHDGESWGAYYGPEYAKAKDSVFFLLQGM